VLLCVRNVFVSHEACSLLLVLWNASVIYVMHPNHMSDYIYCVYVNKMHRKVFFYEITTHFHLKVYFYPNANYSLLFIRGVHINIFANA
jgi:hypothetical protein